MRTAVAVLSLVLVLAACHQTPKAEEGPEPVLNFLATLPFVSGPPAPAREWPLPEAGKAFELTFRFHDGEKVLMAPRLTTLPAQRAELRIMNQMSYISDFDVEIASTAVIGDPVVDIVTEGIRIDCAAVATPDGKGVVLAWRVELAELTKPIRRREVLVGIKPEALVVQLPIVDWRAAAGRVLLEPGVATRLTRIVTKGRDLAVSVSAAPVPVPGPDHRDVFLPEGEAEPAEPEEDALLDTVGERAPPDTGERITVTLAATRGPRPDSAVHMDASMDDDFLAGYETLISQEFAAVPEAGAEVRWTTEFAYHGDYELEVLMSDSVYDPIIDTLELGFRGRFGIRDGEPVISWHFSTLSEFETFDTKLGELPITMCLPNVHDMTGRLRLRGAIDAAPIGILEDGRTVVLVVRRSIPR